MTMVFPCRLITRQRSHMGLTDALTFIFFSLSVSVGDPAAGQLVGRQLHLDLLPRPDSNGVLPAVSGTCCCVRTKRRRPSRRRTVMVANSPCKMLGIFQGF